MPSLERDIAAATRGPRVSAALRASAWRPELAATLTLAWPLVVAQLAQIALMTTDVIMMGWLGAEDLAAGTLAAAFLHPLFLFGMGTVMAVTPLVAQAIGARDFRNVRRSTRQGFWVAITLSALLIPALWQTEAFFLFVGQEAEVSVMAGGYNRYASFMLLSALLFVALRSFLSAHGDTRIILWITGAGIFVNALGNYGLMFGNFGLPRMELRGAGLSTSIVSAVNLAFAIAYVVTHRRFRRYYLFVRFWRPDWQRYRAIFRLGTPIGLTMLAETGMFASAAMFMGWLGTDELAGHAIALQLAAIAFMVPLGLSMATTVRVGLAAGRRDRPGVAVAGWTSLVLGIGFMGCTALLFLAAPALLVSAFLDPEVEANRIAFSFAVTYLGVAALFQLVDGAQVVSAAALRGLGDTAVPMVVAVTGYWLIGMPVAYLCGFVLELRGLGVWYGLAAGLAFVAVVLTLRFAMRERLGLVGGG
ncbi:MAG: MATE family efflux transporter [Rhizobiaceae bacterium]|nr:MATE family efflux transporter [Rhizobiaceae bacterium]MCV0407394.1 MATE family efflux transporter [Rhizobiaceae bacterium]